MSTQELLGPAPPNFLTIVILQYTNVARTQRCISSLLAAGLRENAHLVVVDNASPDGSGPKLGSWLDSQFDDFQQLDRDRQGADLSRAHKQGSCIFISNDENRGYGPGNNVALDMLRGEAPTWCWILNNDTEISRPDFTRLLAHLRSRDAGKAILGMRVHTIGAPEATDIVGGGHLQAWMGRTKPLTIDRLSKRNASVGRLSYISGSSMIISSEVLRSCGRLVDDHFLFWEEVEYATRAIECGAHLDVLRDVTVNHEQGPTSGARYGSTSPTAAYYSCRSAVLFIGRFHPRALLTACLFRITYAATFAVKGNVSAAKAAFIGVISGLATLMHAQMRQRDTASCI